MSNAKLNKRTIAATSFIVAMAKYIAKPKYVGQALVTNN